MSVRLSAACVLLMGLCAGCITSRTPTNDLGFANVSSLDSFNGCYKNGGDSGGGRPYEVRLGSMFWQMPKTTSVSDSRWEALTAYVEKRYLDGSTIWPGEKRSLDAIDAVKLEAISGGTLRATAIAKHRILHEVTLIADKDFEFNSGQITLRRRTEAVFTLIGAIYGIGYETLTLGLDAAGDLRVRATLAAAGGLFLVVPMAMHSREVTRFKRSSELCGVD